MDETICRRCLDVAQYMLEHRATVRQAAKAFELSKSSVHKDMCQRLPQIDARLARRVAMLMAYNKAVRHLRGGEATKRRYQFRQGLQSSADAL
ncbi:MAG: sporulation transcriptional regulator SpoIIID [Clostridia bacterium]|nr:sporulation transcriptional regulator SpoIIID [Clostridia bacterium]